MSTKNFKEVQQELSNVLLEDMKKQNIYERFILYGSIEELNNVKVIEKIIEYDLLEFIIRKLDIITVNDMLINKMLSSKCFKENNYIIKSGQIEHVTKEIDNSLPKDYCWLVITLRNTTNDTSLIKYIYSDEQYKKDLIRVGNSIKVIIQKSKNNELYLQCFLKEV